MIPVLFASNNRKKFDELEKSFAEVGIELKFPEVHLELPETSEVSLEVNARLKAEAAAKQTGMYSLGDDSGVFIEALDFQPGVFSRRFVKNLPGAENIPEGKEGDLPRDQIILNLMEGLPEEQRECFLISRFVLVSPDGRDLTKTFSKNVFFVTDKINTGGSGSFGYDPILIKKPNPKDPKEKYEKELEYYNNRITIGMLSQEEKNFINDRAGQIRETILKAMKKELGEK